MKSLLTCALLAGVALAADDSAPAWASAARQPPMTATETRAFMKSLAQFAVAHHLKTNAASAQCGMLYEYWDHTRAGQLGEFIQGEGLDTMHDGAWFAVALVNAYRATGDTFYKDILTRWQLPFYLKMLNHGDELFTAERNDGRPGDDRGWRGSKEWLLQGRETGFVPYWWDDGASVSLDMFARKDRDQHVNFAARNALAGQPNPEHRLSGYSHGSSNHMAQDLAVLLEQTWLLFHASSDPAEQKLAVEIAAAAQNLHDCRMRHFGHIPMVCAALALTGGDQAEFARITDPNNAAYWKPDNHYFRAVHAFKPGVRMPVPGFADDQQYRWYHGLAHSGGALPPPLAFKTVYDAFTEPKLYQMYCDDTPAPPGISVFDLHPYYFRDGKPEDLRSARKGPGGKPRPIGSRFGPQNMVCCGWALQALRAQSGLWDKRQAEKLLPVATEAEVKAALERELGGGLRTWEAIFNQYGYIPTGIGAGATAGGHYQWEDLSDTGGYAHLISAAAQWLLYLEHRADWEAQFAKR